MPRPQISQQDWRTIQEAKNIITRRNGDLSYDENFGEQAACADVNPAVFFPNRGQSPVAGKKICAGCPVWLDCLLYSMKHRGSIDWGTYGRLSPGARHELANQLGIEPAYIDPIQMYWGTTGAGLHQMKKSWGEVA